LSAPILNQTTQTNLMKKHYNIMLRRLRNGQHFRQPCLGCREFAIKSIELVDDFDLTQIAPQNMGDKDLGFMLYGMKFEVRRQACQ